MYPGERSLPAENDEPIASAPSDEDLFVRYRTGDRPSLTLLHGRYEEALPRYLRSTFGREEEWFDDVAQETWLKVMRKASAYNPELPFRPWFFRIARNCALSRFREQQSRTAQQMRANAFGEEDLRDPAESALDSLIQRETVERLHTAVQELSAPYKTVIELKLAGGTHAEMMAATGGTSGNLSVWLARATDRVRVLLFPLFADLFPEDGGVIPVTPAQAAVLLAAGPQSAGYADAARIMTPHLFKALRRYPWLQSADIDDCVQRTFLQALQSEALISDPQPLHRMQSMARVIAYDLRIERTRRRRDESRNVPLEAARNIAAPRAPGMPERQEFHAVLQRLLGDENYALFAAHEFDDVPVAQLAEGNGLSEAATMKRLQRMRGMLRTQLPERGIGPDFFDEQ